MPPYDRSVFINCPFDEDFQPLLHAIVFVVLYLGFEPRLATERDDAGESRLDKIRQLIEESRYSIHDLSRCKATEAGEIFRLNMPFELGIDYGCRKFLPGREDKRFLILEEERYRFQRALSDISGSDIRSHGGEYDRVMTEVLEWFRLTTGARSRGPSTVIGKYIDWQEWHWEWKLSEGYSEADILRYPTFEIIESIRAWIHAGEPEGSV